MIINYTNAKLSSFAIHYVGNKSLNEGTIISESEINDLQEDFKSTIISYLLSGFKSYEIYNFWHESELELNTVFKFCKDIFGQKNTFNKKSQNIAKHLYEHSVHHNINGGELLIARIQDCIYKDELCNVLAVVKSEHKENFIKTMNTNSGIIPTLESGLSLKSIDKGCLIIETDPEKGYDVMLIEKSKNSDDTVYWKDNFLRVKPELNNYSNTTSFLSMTKNYLSKQIEKEFEVNTTDKIDLLNKSIEYFKENEIFERSEFEKTVFNDQNLIQAFKSFEANFTQKTNIEISDNFEISVPALKTQSKLFKNIIKLDKNFHLYVHGSKELIEKGFDPITGMNYYKIFFKEES